MFLDASVYQKELLLFGENKIEQNSSIVMLRTYLFLHGVDHTPKSAVHMLCRYAACRASKSVGFDMR